MTNDPCFSGSGVSPSIESNTSCAEFKKCGKEAAMGKSESKIYIYEINIIIKTS